MSQHSVGRTRLINLPAELGWISKNLPRGPRPSGCALGPWALGQVFTDPPELCWQVYPRQQGKAPPTKVTIQLPKHVDRKTETTASQSEEPINCEEFEGTPQSRQSAGEDEELLTNQEERGEDQHGTLHKGHSTDQTGHCTMRK